MSERVIARRNARGIVRPNAASFRIVGSQGLLALVNEGRDFYRRDRMTAREFARPAQRARIKAQIRAQRALRSGTGSNG